MGDAGAHRRGGSARPRGDQRGAGDTGGFDPGRHDRRRVQRGGGINPASTLIPVTRIEGITTALAVPAGNLVSGQAVLIDLDGATIEQMLVKSPVGVVADLSESGKDDAGGSRARIAERLR